MVSIRTTADVDGRKTQLNHYRKSRGTAPDDCGLRFIAEVLLKFPNATIVPICGHRRLPTSTYAPDSRAVAAVAIVLIRRTGPTGPRTTDARGGRRALGRVRAPVSIRKDPCIRRIAVAIPVETPVGDVRVAASAGTQSCRHRPIPMGAADTEMYAANERAVAARRQHAHHRCDALRRVDHHPPPRPMARSR